MITNRTISVLVALALFVGGLGTAAHAGPQGTGRGSLLVFPYFDSTPGSGTVVTITNLNDSGEYCPTSDTRAGDITVHFQYINGETSEEYDLFEWLTPGDTLSVIVSQHNPRMNEGFLVVTATRPYEQQGATAVDFDWLFGSAIVVQSGLDLLWSYPAYAFSGIEESSPCDLVATDADGDGATDFDGVEYDTFPSEILIDSFFEEGASISNRLILCTTAGRTRTSEIEVYVYNNIARAHSASHEMPTFWQGALSEISYAAEALRGDPMESGLPVETGWVSIVGGRILDRSGNPVRDASGGVAKAPILGVFSQHVASAGFTIGQGLHFQGSLDGLEFFAGDSDPQMTP